MTEDKATRYLKIHPGDNVLVALKDLPSGTSFSLGNEELVLPQDVPAKHKFYINNDMKEGDKRNYVWNTRWKSSDKYS